MKLSIIIDLILIAVIWTTATIGYKKGLVKTIYGLCAFLLAAVITALCYEYVAEYLMSLKIVNEWIGELNQFFASKINIGSGLDSSLPIWMSDALKTTAMGAEETIISKLVEIIVMIVTIVVTFLLSKFVLGLFVGLLDKIMRLPILDVINKTGGMLAGLIHGAVIVMICFGIVAIFVATGDHEQIHNAINETYAAKYFYNNNLLMTIIMK